MREDRYEVFLGALDVRGEDECWEWKRFLSRKGYGRFYDGVCMVQAHRYSYELFKGVTPGKLHILHKCDNKKCCNPNHLFLGTNRDNVDDAISKGIHHSARFTWEKAEAIRTRYAAGERARTLAKELGVSTSSINRVVNGETWNTPGYESLARMHKGENHSLARLTWDKVHEIRKRYTAGGVSQKGLATEYGVGIARINHIVRNLAWVE